MTQPLKKFSLLCCDVQDILPQEVEWMWEVKELKSFLDWFLEYPDDANCLSCEDYKSYMDWFDSGMELSGPDLDEALAQYGFDVDKYTHMSISQEEIEITDKEIEELKVQDEALSEVESIIGEELRNCLTNEQTLVKQLRNEQMVCQKEGQNLMKVNSSLKSNYSDLFRNLATLVTTNTNPDSKNCFFSSMLLKNFLYTCDKVNEYTNLILKRNLEQTFSSEKTKVAESMSFFHNEVSVRSNSSSSSYHISNDLPNKMWKTALSKIEKHGTLVGYGAAVKHLENWVGNNVNVHQMKMEMPQILNNISRLTEEINFLMKHEAPSRVEEVVICQIADVVNKITVARAEARHVTLRKLCSVGNVMRKFLYLTDIVWMMFMLEYHRLKVATDLLKELQEVVFKKYHEHRATMDSLHYIYSDYKLHKSNGSSSSQSLLRDTLQRLISINTSNEDPINQLQEELESTLFMDVLETFKNQNLNPESSIFELCTELSNGPTKKPNLMKMDISLRIKEVLAEFHGNKKEFENISSLFEVKELAFKKYPVDRNRRLLWAWFLVAPEQLQEAIELARRESKSEK